MDVVTDFGEYTLAMRADDAFMVIDQHLAIKSEELSGSRKEDYSAFRKSVVDNASSISSREVKVEDPAARSLYNAAKRSEERRDYSGSAELYRQAVEKDPKYTEAWNALGWSYSQMQEFDRAEAALRKAIELDPKLYYVHGNLGYALFRQKKYAEAIEEYKKSEEIKPDLAWTHAQLGWSYLDTEKYKEAVTEFEQATKSLPGDPGMQFGLAQAYAKSGQGEKAMQAFKRSLDIEPTPMQMNNVAYQMALNDLHLDQARKYVESSISTTETQMKDVSLEHLTDHDLETGKALNYFWDTLGWIDYRDGKLAEAEKYIRAAWILSGRAEIGDHLGQIYEKEGKKQEAIDAYAQSITAEDPVKETKARLAALAGGEANVGHATEHSREVWEHERKLQVKNEHGAEGMAEFWILTGRDGGGVRAEETKFIAGDEGLREAGNEIKEAKFEDVFVDAGDYKMLRKGRLACMSAGVECTLTLELAEKVRGVN